MTLYAGNDLARSEAERLVPRSSPHIEFAIVATASHDHFIRGGNNNKHGDLHSAASFVAWRACQAALRPDRPTRLGVDGAGDGSITIEVVVFGTAGATSAGETGSFLGPGWTSMLMGSVSQRCETKLVLSRGLIFRSLARCHLAAFSASILRTRATASSSSSAVTAPAGWPSRPMRGT